MDQCRCRSSMSASSRVVVYRTVLVSTRYSRVVESYRGNSLGAVARSPFPKDLGRASRRIFRLLLDGQTDLPVLIQLLFYILFGRIKDRQTDIPVLIWTERMKDKHTHDSTRSIPSHPIPSHPIPSHPIPSHPIDQIPSS
jgi:hypothetical protein